MTFIPAEVARNMDMSHVVEYDTEVKNKFPCPEGYEEIEYGYIGRVYNRDSLIERYLEYWDDFNYVAGFKEGKVTIEVDPCWYVKKI